jgi:hypothetical protein
MNEGDDFEFVRGLAEDKLDAIRYRTLRAMAMDFGSLTAFVACEALDHVSSKEQFDETVDRARWPSRPSEETS